MRKTVVIYGLIAGIVLILLQVTHYSAIIRDIKIELFGLIIAIITVPFGIWLGMKVVVKKNSVFQSTNKSKEIKLSERELEVLTLMADGLSNQEMADRLFVSLNTIKTHNAKIFQKMNVARRTQAVKKAKDLEIIVETII